jgi:hypothetical protein
MQTTEDQQYYIFEKCDEGQFLEWHKGTSWGEGYSKYPKPFLSKDKTRSAAWKYYLQIAMISNGQPKIICQLCNSIIEHPNKSGNNTGTSGLQSHLNSTRCKGKHQSSAQTTIVLHTSKVNTHVC